MSNPFSKRILVSLCAALCLLTAHLKPAAAQAPAAVRIILVGDSTVALKNGWGPGFCELAAPEVKCVNMAKNGRSSGSYRAEGSWKAVLGALHEPFSGKTYVLLQFGHNDQPGKPGRSTDLATEFPVNMRQYVKEIVAAGASPVLVTPLTRRSFVHGTLKNDLRPWAEATVKVATDEGVPLLDLNAESAAAVQKMGPSEANTMAMAPAPPEVVAGARNGDSPPAPKTPATGGFDYTHHGPKGSTFFGAMVAGELMAAVPALNGYFKR
jgi:lysophospholipase L1-like esterase